MKISSALAVVALLTASAAIAETELPELGDVAESVLPQQVERRIGESALRELKRSPAYLDDVAISAYLEALAARLVATSPVAGQSLELFVLRDPSINAFAMPGGFIGIHTGLLLAAESESELAAVLAHEIAHISQRHIARMVQRQRQVGLASIGAIALAILAARAGGDAPHAAIAATQAGVIQTQLNFSREFEREADRVGLGILAQAGFDVRGMPIFFDRLYRKNRLAEGQAPAYLRTHPLTLERIADVASRVEQFAYRQVVDSAEFVQLRVKLRAELDSAASAADRFTRMIGSDNAELVSLGHYGMALALLRSGDLSGSARHAAALRGAAVNSPLFAVVEPTVLARQGNHVAALKLLEPLLHRFPHDRGVTYAWIESLLGAQRPTEALRHIQTELNLRRPEAGLMRLQALAFAMLNQRMAQHRAQADAYYLAGDVAAAVEQLELARASADGDYYEASQVDARLRQLRAELAELLPAARR
jgi:predicted Zn-dependent protease